MRRMISVPILITTYECGPPIIEQCPDCSFGIEVAYPAIKGITDGWRRNVCCNNLNQNKKRKYDPGICIFFKQKQAQEGA